MANQPHAAQRLDVLTKTALDEGRGFTDAEEAEARDLLAQVERDAKKAADQQSLADFAALLGVDPTKATASPVDPAKRATKSLTVRPAESRGTWGKAVLDAATDATGRFKGLTPSGTVLTPVDLRAEPYELGRPVTTLLTLVPTAPNALPHFGYFAQTVRETEAAFVAPGDVKPTSRYTVERIDDRVRTLAHLSEPINRADLADAPSLQQFIETEMRYGLDLTLQNQMVDGDGVGENLTGIFNVSGTQAQTFDTDVFVTTRRALALLEDLGYPAGAFAMAASDWVAADLEVGTDGHYIGSGPMSATPIDRAARTLWGVPVVTVPGLAPGQAVVGDWAGSATLHVREQATLTWSENVSDDFTKNLLRFRCEGRFGLAWERPAAFVVIELGNP